MTRVRRGRSPAGLAGFRHLSRLVAIAWAIDRDEALVSLAAELEAKEAALRALFARDGRDTEDMPEFEVLADRCGVLVERLRTTPARGLDGLSAKARCVRLRDPAAGYDAALLLGSSLAVDVLRLFGPPS